MCFVVQGAPKGPISSLWVVDSGASGHMTGDISLLFDIKTINGGYLVFAGKQRGLYHEGRLHVEWNHEL